MLQKKTGKSNIARYVAWCLLALLLLTVCGAGGALAYLKLSGGHAENSFLAAPSVAPTIEETFDQQEKRDVRVSVGETGYSVYVRAAVLITWKNQEGYVLAEHPSLARHEYEVTYELTEYGWFLGPDGFYYYHVPVESGGQTSALIQSCKPLAKAPEEGYALDVEILVQTIQAAGETDGSNAVPAVTNAWGVTVQADKSIRFD